MAGQYRQLHRSRPAERQTRRPPHDGTRHRLHPLPHRHQQPPGAAGQTPQRLTRRCT